MAGNMFDSPTVANLQMSNRVVYSPFVENQANSDGTVSQKLYEYYLDLAREGAGLVILESAYVAGQGRGSFSQLGLSEERHTEPLYRLVKAMQAEGSAVGIRLSHAGARTSEAICGEQPIAPSVINFGKDYNISREFDEGDIEEISLFFIHAAERAEEIEANLIEINGSQISLFDQCLSKRFNHRFDNYGGPVEGRMRLPTEILKAIKSRISPKLPISYFFSIHDKLDDGFTDADLKTLLHSLSGAKVDIIHPVTIHVMNKFFETDDTLVEWVAKSTRKPIVAEGNIKSPQILKEVIAMGKAQIYALDKAIFTRPNWFSFLQKKIVP